MKPKIVVIGSSNVDYVMKMERLPRAGETVTGARFMQAFGGKGANQALAAARAGGDTWFASCIGDDAVAREFKESLRRSGLHVDHVAMQAGVPGGAALILIGGGGENCIAVAPGANDRLTPQMVPSFEPLLRGAAMLILQYELLPETLYACIDLGHALGVPVMFNLAPARPFDPAYLAKVACLVLNESEAEALCGFPVDMPERVEQAAGDLLARGAGTVILTLGAAGAFLASTGLRQKVPAFRVEPVDTTAAGDVFCGALAVALVEGRPLPEAARFACAASAISVTRMGAQPSVPERAEIDAFLERNQA